MHRGAPPEGTDASTRNFVAEVNLDDGLRREQLTL